MEIILIIVIALSLFAALLVSTLDSVAEVAKFFFSIHERVANLFKSKDKA